MNFKVGEGMAVELERLLLLLLDSFGGRGKAGAGASGLTIPVEDQTRPSNSSALLVSTPSGASRRMVVRLSEI